MKKIFELLFPSLTSSFVRISPAKRTVDGALVHFKKAIEELKAVKSYQDAEAVKQATIASDAQIALDAAVAEAQRAARGIAKIEDFIV